MKEAIRSYFSFHRSQRIGIIILMSLLLVLLSAMVIRYYPNATDTSETTKTMNSPTKN